MKKLFLLILLSFTLIVPIVAADINEGEIGPGINPGLNMEFSCNPASVSNGSVNPINCAITCNSGYTPSGSTCVAAGGSSSGGGGGGGSSSGGGYNSTYYLSELRSITPITLINRKVDLPSSGVFTCEVTMKNTRSGITTNFPLDTKVTDENGDPYLSWIETPAKILPGLVPGGGTPGGGIFVFGFSLGTGNGLNNIFFDQEVEVRIPLPEKYFGRDDLHVYYYNEETDKYVRIAQDKISLSDDGTELIILIDHFTRFVIVDPLTMNEIDMDNIADDASTPFNDIKGHWAESYIAKIYDLGIVSGKDENTYAPDANLTRAELAKIVINAFGYSFEESVFELPFSDIPTTTWYATYINSAKENGIVEGYTDGTFRPNNPVTRVEALKMVLEASELEITGGEMNFPDTVSGQWYEKYVAYSQLEGIVEGYEDDTFGPANNITRAEIAKVILKILEM